MTPEQSKEIDELDKKLPPYSPGELGRFEHRHQVQAGKIEAIAPVVIKGRPYTTAIVTVGYDDDTAEYPMDARWLLRHGAVVGGYIVRDHEKILSFMRGDVFEAQFKPATAKPEDQLIEAIKAKLSHMVLMSDGETHQKLTAIASRFGDEYIQRFIISPIEFDKSTLLALARELGLSQPTN